MWFDGEWEATWNHEYGEALYKLCRSLQPGVIVNNRVDKGRGGMGGMSDEGYFGDFGTPEQTIPATGIPGVDWETCMTMNGNWGYNSHDTDWKSTEDLIQKLCDIASKGGNFLLNIGPKADGTFPQESIDRLREIGDWMDVNGEAIYATTASPFGLFDWGRCTVKAGEESSTLYLHVFDWPSAGVLRLEGLGSEVTGARLLADIGRDVGVVQKDGAAYFQVGTVCPDPLSAVLAVEIVGAPVVFRAPTIEALTDTIVNPIEVTVNAGSPGLVARYTLDGSEPTTRSPKIDGPVTIAGSCTLSARSFHEGKAVGATTRRAFEKVTPRPGATAGGTRPGLACEVYDGDFNTMPDFDAMTPASRETMATVALPDKYTSEKVGRRYSGFILTPADDAYSFALTSDDGSRLFIDGELVVDHDGLHSSGTKLGVAALGKGWHAITVEWFNKTGGADLSLKMGPAGGDLAPVATNSLSH